MFNDVFKNMQFGGLFGSVADMLQEDIQSQECSKAKEEIDKSKLSIPKSMKATMELEKKAKYSVKKRPVKPKLAISLLSGRNISLSNVETIDSVKKYFN